MKRSDFFKALPFAPIVILAGTKPIVNNEKIEYTLSPENYRKKPITPEDLKDILLEMDKRIQSIER